MRCYVICAGRLAFQTYMGELGSSSCKPNEERRKTWSELGGGPTPWAGRPTEGIVLFHGCGSWKKNGGSAEGTTSTQRSIYVCNARMAFEPSHFGL